MVVGAHTSQLSPDLRVDYAEVHISKCSLPPTVIKMNNARPERSGGVLARQLTKEQ